MKLIKMKRRENHIELVEKYNTQQEEQHFPINFLSLFGIHLEPVHLVKTW
jgi:hypothetical protein